MSNLKFRQPKFNRKGEFTEFHYWGFIDGAFVQPETNLASIKEAKEVSQQFTGMTDRNEVEIFTGDVLLVHNFYFDGHSEAERECIGVVECNEFGYELCGVRGWVAKYMGYEDGDKESHIRIADLVPERFMGVPDAKHAELLDMWGHHEESYLVIGNIHQNPELL